MTITKAYITREDDGSVYLTIRWSDDSSTAGRIGNLHMWELLTRAQRDGIAIEIHN